MNRPDETVAEWLEPDQLGGFSMGTATGIRTRRYHTLLTCATVPPTGRVALVAGLEVWLETHAGPVFLSNQRYAPDVIHPDGHSRIASFGTDPWPTWTYAVDGRRLIHEVFTHRASGEVVLSWRVGPTRGSAEVRLAPITLAVRPLLAVRDYHALQRQNAAFRFDATRVGENVAWRPYDFLPAITALSSGQYEHAPTWYRNFLYEHERARGLDHIEDLASPGVFRFRVGPGSGPRSGDAVIVLRAGHAPYGDAAAIADQHRASEIARRECFADPLERAADAYLVNRSRGLTIIAGYPWFTDWGRDTFIALRGLYLATGRFDAARRVLVAWADAVSDGMLPNRFTDAGEAPEFNAVDASLWYVVAVGELLEGAELPADDARHLLAAVGSIVDGYRRGTRYRIRADDDGLLAAGEPGVQLTWMDAKIGDRVITPRIGKPVEIQALWINALAVAERVDRGLAALRKQATNSFVTKFSRGDGALYDVVDVDHVPGAVDRAFRPNQIFAVGGLPIALLHGTAARALVDAVERTLWTPLGLRSLDPADPAYRGQYLGDGVERDEAYHQGTVWPWLAGPFIEAWLRVRENAADAREQARRRFLAPFLAQLQTGGLGHLPEIADGDPPHAPRGTPFQAWSLGELLRVRSLLEG